MGQEQQPDNETEEREQTMGEEVKGGDVMGTDVLNQIGNIVADMTNKSDEEIEQALNELLGDGEVKVFSLSAPPEPKRTHHHENHHHENHPPVEIRNREGLNEMLVATSEAISNLAKAVLDERFDGLTLERAALEWSDFFMSIVITQTQDHAVQDYKNSPIFLRDVLKVVDEVIGEQKEKEKANTVDENVDSGEENSTEGG